MITIHFTGYTSNLVPHSPIALTDEACEYTYDHILDRYREHPLYDQDWCISSENLYNRIRVGIVEGEIDCEDVRFVYGDQILRPNRYGAITDWPKGFCDYNIQLVERILLGSFEVRKQERHDRPLREFGPNANPEAVRIYMTNALRDRVGTGIIHTRSVEDGHVTMRFYSAPANGQLFDSTVDPLFVWQGE